MFLKVMWILLEGLFGILREWCLMSVGLYCGMFFLILMLLEIFVKFLMERYIDILVLVKFKKDWILECVFFLLYVFLDWMDFLSFKNVCILVSEFVMVLMKLMLVVNFEEVERWIVWMNVSIMKILYVFSLIFVMIRVVKDMKYVIIEFVWRKVVNVERMVFFCWIYCSFFL